MTIHDFVTAQPEEWKHLEELLLSVPKLDTLSLEEVIQKVNQSSLVSIRTVILQLMQVLDDPKTNAHQLVAIIERDPPLTAKILRMANSAYYGSDKKIHNVKQAVVRLGFNTLRELAVRHKLQTLYSSDTMTSDYSRDQLWKHCVAVALTARHICRCEFCDPGDSIYTTGILHDIGIIIIDQFLNKHFRALLAAHEAYNLPLHLLEKRMLGFDHAQLGKHLLRSWQFPADIYEPIGAHHNLTEAAPAYEMQTMVLCLSNILCHSKTLNYESVPFLDDEMMGYCMNTLHLEQASVSLIQSDVSQQILLMEAEGWL